jgi:S1-C subfamily serine protease
MRLLWIFFVLVGLLLLPGLIHSVQYAITSAKQEARRDVARETLKRLGKNAELLSVADVSVAFEAVASSVGPGVVHIDTTQIASGQQRRVGGYLLMTPDQRLAGQGSGVIVDEQGYIVTNYHVVANADRIRVSLSDGRSIDQVELIGVDPATDLAVLKIHAEDLTAVPWGDSEEMRVGHWVLAIGNPFGLDRTVTSGIISATRRPSVMEGKARYQSFLQTDAAVNPGSSGGPLVNLQGQVIGINTAIVGDSYRGISFAIPSKLAQEVYTRLLETGTVERGFLGVALQELTPELSIRLGVEMGSGVVIAAVDEDSPAAEGGLQVLDVIVSFEGEPVTDAPDLAMRVAHTDAGDKVQLEVIRQGNPLTFEVTIAPMPSELQRR